LFYPELISFVQDKVKLQVYSGVVIQTHTIFYWWFMFLFLFQVVAETIRSCLDELPGFPRTQIGFATFDSAIHFYNMKVCNIISIAIVNISLSLP